MANEDLDDQHLCRDLALWVRAYAHQHHGRRPSWTLIARQARPELSDPRPDSDNPAPAAVLLGAYTERLLIGLKNRRWLSCDDRPGSARQGPPPV
ncbi:hypothetical protein ABZ914_03805 [Spirillospora sp. NPDC046719]